MACSRRRSNYVKRSPSGESVKCNAKNMPPLGEVHVCQNCRLYAQGGQCSSLKSPPACVRQQFVRCCVDERCDLPPNSNTERSAAPTADPSRLLRQFWELLELLKKLLLTSILGFIKPGSASQVRTPKPPKQPEPNSRLLFFYRHRVLRKGACALRPCVVVCLL